VIVRLPPSLTAEQFAFLTQFNVEVIRRKCRANIIKSVGNPIRIPPRELLAFGMTLEDAAIALRERELTVPPVRSAFSVGPISMNTETP